MPSGRKVDSITPVHRTYAAEQKMPRSGDLAETAGRNSARQKPSVRSASFH